MGRMASRTSSDFSQHRLFFIPGVPALELCITIPLIHISILEQKGQKTEHHPHRQSAAEVT